jgi:hypothetical protein
VGSKGGYARRTAQVRSPCFRDPPRPVPFFAASVASFPFIGFPRFIGWFSESWFRSRGLAGCRGGGKHLVVHRDEERAETVGLREERVEARGE